jgi:hypothetical protein
MDRRSLNFHENMAGDQSHIVNPFPQNALAGTKPEFGRISGGLGFKGSPGATALTRYDSRGNNKAGYNEGAEPSMLLDNTPKY